MGELSRTKATLLIAALVIMWGLCWPIYKAALAYTPPILFAGMRTLLGGILLGAVIAPTYRKLRWKQTWPIYFISAFFNAFLFYGLQTVGLNYLPSGLFTVLVYLQPVIVGLFAWMWLGESMSTVKAVGLIMGFFGVCVISLSSVEGHLSVTGIVLALITAVSWAYGTVYVKKVGHRADPMWLVCVQCIIGGLALTGVGFGAEPWSGIVWNVPYLSGLIYGAIFGIPASWVVFFTLVKSGDASKVASFTFLVPLLAVFLGTLFLHEPFTMYLLIGLALIVVSIYLVNRPARKKVTNGTAQTNVQM